MESTQSDSLQKRSDVPPTPVTAQQGQQTPEKDLQGVVIEFEAAVNATTLFVNLGIGHLKEILLDARNEIHEEFVPLDSPTVELERFSQRTVCDERVQLHNVLVAEIPSAETETGHYVDGSVYQRVSVPGSEMQGVETREGGG